MGPAGVFVIDARRYEGQIHIRVSTVSSAGRLLRAARLLGPLVDYRGKLVVHREDDASLFAFDKTGTLVPTGIR